MFVSIRFLTKKLSRRKPRTMREFKSRDFLLKPWGATSSITEKTITLGREAVLQIIAIPDLRLLSRGLLTFLIAFGVLIFPDLVAAQDTDLSELSLEELLNVEVTSVSKKAEKRTEAAAAIYVITNDDIRRSGATTIPEILRSVPGISVARLDASKWSVTSRGFGGRFANKLLVLIDGRSVYTPQFSGVYWESNEVMLEDVDRIEIIRGPGGTLWGANAVNGVINIVTKPAEDTQGGLVSVGMGTEEEGFTAFRYGGKLREKGFYRTYFKGNYREEGSTITDSEADDDWRTIQAGTRMDLKLSEKDRLTIQGDYFANKTSSTATFR